jgi:MFS family permease
VTTISRSTRTTILGAISAPLAVFAAGPSLAILAAMAFVSNLGVGLMGPLIPLFGVSVGATPAQLGLVTSAFALMNAAGAIGTGLLVKRLGARAFIGAGIGTYAVANFAVAIVRDAAGLIASRAAAGLGTGAGMVGRRIYLTDSTDPRRLAFANGVLSAADAAGQVAGPAIGGVLFMMADLRLPFIVVGVTSALAFLGSLALPRADTQEVEESEVAEDGPASVINRSSVLLLLGQLLVLAGYGMVITVWSPFATTMLNWPVLEVAIVFSIFGAGSIVLGPPLAALADRTSRRRVAALGVVPLVVWNIALVAQAPRPALYGITLIAGGGFTAFEAAWYALLSGASPSNRRSQTMAIVVAISNLGIILGATGSTLVWEAAGITQAMLLTVVPLSAASLALLALPAGGEHRSGATR